MLSKNPDMRARQLANLKPFKKGNKPQNSGRPKLAQDFRKKCREFMDAEGWDLMLDMARDPKSPHQARMLELIVAYDIGKPSQAVEHAGTVNLNVRYDNPQPGHTPADPAR